jgi:hypothetical protein
LPASTLCNDAKYPWLHRTGKQWWSACRLAR